MVHRNPTPPHKVKRIPWDQVREAFVYGPPDQTVTNVAERFGLSVRSCQAKAHEEQWFALRDAARSEVAAQIRAQYADRMAKAASEHCLKLLRDLEELRALLLARAKAEFSAEAKPAVYEQVAEVTEGELGPDGKPRTVRRVVKSAKPPLDGDFAASILRQEIALASMLLGVAPKALVAQVAATPAGAAAQISAPVVIE